jgi:hypothetical protein
VSNHLLLLTACFAAFLHAAAAGASTRYVSKLGDNTDGTTWAKAFHTIQAALDAVPDDKGGHRILIRPDTYMEANLYPAFKGAPGAYNTLEADHDGASGSGAVGYAVIDSGDPKQGFKSVDWWSTFKANPEFSGIGWDRWNCRRLYATGGDAGLFWDLPPKEEPFTVVVEDSVGIGRAFGGGVGHFLPRADEPIVFRRCHLWCLDWWGDASGAYVRAENPTMPDKPDIYFEDCALVGPDNALKAGNPGFSGYTRIKAKNCRLLSLNYSQPRGTPSRGVIFSVIDGKFMQVDLEDCTLMGYKIFGAGNGEVGYTTKGCVRAYVQYEQETPKGFFRIGYWPPEIFQSILPPDPQRLSAQIQFKKDTVVIRRDMCEASPVIWNGRLCRMECIRPAGGGTPKDYCLKLMDVESGAELARFAEGYSLACAIVHNNTFYAFASRFDPKGWNDVTMFKSTDLKTWDNKIVITQESNEQLFNSSVCASPNGFTMAYETNDPKWPAFTVKFATSNDLETWTKQDEVFGKDRYTACPCIRYADGYYYLMYTEHRTPRWFFEVYIARSKDLKDWQVSGANPFLTADQLDECIDASDPDIIEFGGKTYVYYSVGDQLTWMNIKQAVFPGPMADFLKRWF